MYSLKSLTIQIMSVSGAVLKVMRNTSSKLKKDKVQHLVDLEIRLMKYQAEGKDRDVEELIHQVRKAQIGAIQSLKPPYEKDRRV